MSDLPLHWDQHFEPNSCIVVERVLATGVLALDRDGEFSPMVRIDLLGHFNKGGSIELILFADAPQCQELGQRIQNGGLEAELDHAKWITLGRPRPPMPPPLS